MVCNASYRCSPPLAFGSATEENGLVIKIRPVLNQLSDSKSENIIISKLSRLSDHEWLGGWQAGMNFGTYAPVLLKSP